MTDIHIFDDIRPFTDEEVPAAMARIVADPAFPALAGYIYPGADLGEIKQKILSFTTVRDFQVTVMRAAIRALLDRTKSTFEYTGIDRLKKDRSYLIVSNHRDIVLDAMLLQLALVDNGLDTSEITFGANLMSSQIVTDLGKVNKMFRVERPGLSISSPRDFYRSSLHLSEYIRYVLTEKRQSVWIAQRNGRTKDGIDRTDPGIIKMFGMSGSGLDKVDSMAQLNIAPIAVSYEWEPCDILKVLELYQSARMSYEKKPGEDLNSVITGLLSDKGRICFNICEPVTRTELEQFSGMTLNEFRTAVASLIDRRIIGAYTLSSCNYLAHDLMYGKNEFADRYTPEQKKKFLERAEQLLKYDTFDLEELRSIFLGIYSNPVDSKLKLGMPLNPVC